MRRIKRCKTGIPAGRSSYVIYAVVLNDHPDIVKIGRASNWRSRKKFYENWNLSLGTGIKDFAAYCITEEWVNLPSLEEACLSAMNTRPYRGREWFKAQFDFAKLAIEDTLQTADLSYIELHSL
jgi:hypothetical protein